MIFKSMDALEDEGFEGFKTIKELFISCSIVPKVKGVYLVLRDGSKEPKFVQKGVGGYFKNKDPNVPVSTLESKWVNDTVVLYIGKAGCSSRLKSTAQTLNKRIKTYMRFGKGKAAAHYGGRYIWQLKDYKNLIVCWKTLPEAQSDPLALETKLLNVFYNAYGKLPFANLKI